MRERLDSIDSNFSTLRRNMWVGFGIRMTILYGGFVAIRTSLNYRKPLSNLQAAPGGQHQHGNYRIHAGNGGEGI